MTTFLRCALAALIACAAAADDTLAWRQWRITPDAWSSVLCGGAPTCTIGGNGFAKPTGEAIENGRRLHAQVGDILVTHDLTMTKGVVTSRWRGVVEGAANRGIEVMIGFAGADLANRAVVVDGQKVKIPAEFAQHHVAAGRSFTLFAEQPARVMTVAFTACRSADLRDFRDHVTWPGRDDLQLFAVPDDDGVVEFTIDLRKSDTP